MKSPDSGVPNVPGVRPPVAVNTLTQRFRRSKRHWARLRKMRFGITLKMFLAVLSACLLISLTMGYAVRISFENGFLHYVKERDTGREKALITRLAAGYTLHGSWDFLRLHPQSWIALLDAAREDSRRQDAADALTDRGGRWHAFPGSGTVHQLLGSLAGENGNPHWGMHVPHSLPDPAENPNLPSDPAASGVVGLPFIPPAAPLPPATLLDAEKHLIVSTNYGAIPMDDLKPVIVDGKTVGWLRMNGADTLSNAADIAFQAQQMRSTLQIAVVAVLLAALVALLLARVVLAPVKRLMNATHRLARGDFTARVPAGRHDELDQLAGDFNMLANSLEKAERSRRDFIADISHELRTPLAVLRSELEAIEDGVHAFDHDSLTSLQTEVKMLNAIIEDLYELSLSDVGALSYRKIPADVSQLARASVDAFREAFKAKRLTLQLVVPSSVIFEVDPGRFTQLLKNLLQNSLRYTDPDGGATVTIAIDTAEWQLIVEDSAPGVPVNALPHLFDRLYRVDESRSRQSGGAGLGLAICSAIVAAHGGSIEASAAALGGVRITAHFPIEAAA